jgi:two-component system response regulator AtoC
MSNRRRLSIVRGTAPTTPGADDPMDQPALGPAMRALAGLAARVARSTLPVLILGETGVGKEVLARSIHRRSAHGAGPFLAINCGGLSEALADSELFGYERGAFTGAVAAKVGLLEAANGGSVLLDEIGEMPLSMQAKVLRALDGGEVLPVGAVRPRPIDVRILAATNRNLEQEVRQGTFRRDLLYRLNAVEIRIPPLRERQEEIPALAARLVADACRTSGRQPPTLSRRLLDRLVTWRWPGNVRELKQAMELALVLCDGNELDLEHLPGQESAAASSTSPPVEARLPPEHEEEKGRMIAALEASVWNQTAAARLLGMPRRTFVAKMIRYRIPRPRAPHVAATQDDDDTPSPDDVESDERRR